jgi:hypothetical protein
MYTNTFIHETAVVEAGNERYKSLHFNHFHVTVMQQRYKKFQSFIKLIMTKKGK